MDEVDDYFQTGSDNTVFKLILIKILYMKDTSLFNKF